MAYQTDWTLIGLLVSQALVILLSMAHIATTPIRVSSTFMGLLGVLVLAFLGIMYTELSLRYRYNQS